MPARSIMGAMNRSIIAAAFSWLIGTLLASLARFSAEPRSKSGIALGAFVSSARHDRHQNFGIVLEHQQNAFAELLAEIPHAVFIRGEGVVKVGVLDDAGRVFKPGDVLFQKL